MVLLNDDSERMCIPIPWRWFDMMDAAALRWEGGTIGQFSPAPPLPSLPLQTAQKASPRQEGCLSFLQPSLSCFMLQGYLVPAAASKEVV